MKLRLGLALPARRMAFTAVLALSFCLPVFGAPLSPEEVRNLVAESPGLAEYPEASAIILYHSKQLTVRTDFFQVMEEHVLVKILQDRGRRFGDQKRMFDARTDSVEVLLARTWLPDLSSVPVEPKAINVITPPELVGAAVYAEIKQKVISYSSIAPGVVVELITRTLSRPDSAAARIQPYWDAEVFQGDEPVLRKVYTLRVPETFPAPLIYTGGGLGRTQVEEPAASAPSGEKYRTYWWEMRNVPMINRIPYMPPALEFAPCLIFSNVDTWETLGRYLADQFYPPARPDQAIRARAAQLTADCRTSADSVRSIYLFVATQVRNVSLDLGLAGWKPHPAGKVLENMYGDQQDKAVLLSSLLSAAGFANYPALAGAEQIDEVRAEVPSVMQFERMVIYVPGEFHDTTFENPLYREADRNGLWLVPFARYNRYGYFNQGQGSRSLVVMPSGGTLFKTVEFPPEKSLSLSTGELVLAGNGQVKGRFSTVTDGLFDAQARMQLKDLTPRELRQFFQQAANAVGEGANLGPYTLSDLDNLDLPAAAAIEFDAPDLGVVQGGMMILRIPLPPFSFSSLPYAPQLKEREYKFVADGPFVLSGEITIRLPDGWRVAFSPRTAFDETPYGSWVTGCRQEGDRLVFSRRITVQSRFVDVAHYPEFKKFFDNFNLPEHSLLLLEKKSAGSGN
jgi:hypothetical protein